MRSLRLLSSVITLLCLSSFVACNPEQGLSTIVDDPPEAPTPKIEVISISDSPIITSFGCPASGDFLVSSVGTDVLTISDIEMLVTAQTSSTVGGIPTIPFSLDAGDDITISIDFDSIGDTDVVAMLMVSSDDPTLPEATADLTISPEAGDIVIDDFISSSGRDIDLVLVVDNSGSMSSEQSRLTDNAQNIIDGLEANSADYHIGLITTDSAQFVGPMITNSDPDPVAELQSQIGVGTSGNWDEKGIQEAIDVTSGSGDAAVGSAFLRDNASLAIVWVSDEDDNSSGDLTSWASHFWGIKHVPSDVVGWAIVAADDSCSTASPGYDYIDLAQTLGGGITSICESDWRPTFEGLTAIAGTQSTFGLSEIPFVSSIEVTVNGVSSTGWVYVSSSNSVAFNPGFVPAVGSFIEIKYGVSDC